MKNIKKFLVVIACLSLLVIMGHMDHTNSDYAQTWGLGHWVTDVQ